MRIDVILEGIAVLGCVAIVHATPAEGQTITKSFEVAPGGRLLLETDRGAIDVRPTDTLTRLEVAVRNATGIAVEFTQRGPDVQIHGKATRGFWHWSWWKFWRSPQFVVTVPRQYNIDLSTSGGAISVGDLEGEVRSRRAVAVYTLATSVGRCGARRQGGVLWLPAACVPLRSKLRAAASRSTLWKGR